MIKRVFVVGSPRSGTTLLQTMLMASGQLASFTESHFFSRVFSSRHSTVARLSRQFKFSHLSPRSLIDFISMEKVLYSLGLDWNKASKEIVRFLRENLDEEKVATLSRQFPRFGSRRQWAGLFIAILDDISLQNNVTGWIEKTPEHLYYVPLIERIAGSASFIHVVRNVIDVVASQYYISRRFPYRWKVAPIDYYVDTWAHDVKISIAYANQPNHRVIRFEQLINQPCKVLTSLCDFLGIEFREEMLSDFASYAPGVISSDEPWKEENLKALGRYTKIEYLEPDVREYLLQIVKSGKMESLYEEIRLLR